jgi:hypothetical protein
MLDNIDIMRLKDLLFVAEQVCNIKLQGLRNSLYGRKWRQSWRALNF